ncbi:hypothetical protein NA66_10086 [Burkholderia pyrrocinia]|uniref:Uncharacterized protein n=1 Tax=Burkholderia pyrrocinia TaxID=60550 RepID=A0A318IKB2_BURPY|nr:hypothetical protein NA66_10086 [Burkholderia pyrrocinia]SFW68458.1 hypothetical protein SAMN03159384_03813 [Burkholderia sp. NFACC33-1]SFY32640.1 hypothetical protein SAMN03159408_04219 [Burkholderia sp. NFPP32]
MGFFVGPDGGESTRCEFEQPLCRGATVLPRNLDFGKRAAHETIDAMRCAVVREIFPPDVAAARCVAPIRSHGRWRDAPIRASAFGNRQRQHRCLQCNRYRPAVSYSHGSRGIAAGFVVCAGVPPGHYRFRIAPRASFVETNAARSAACRHSPRGTGGGAKPLSLPGNGFALRRSASSSFSFCANSATPITPTFAASPYFEFAT